MPLRYEVPKQSGRSEVLYIRRTRIRESIKYVLRQSTWDGRCWNHRDLFQLGDDPSDSIVYVGGSGFYFHEDLEARLEELQVKYTQDQLEKEFFPYLKPHIRRILENFRGNENSAGRWRGMSNEELWEYQKHLHSFDRRRLHFLRVGRIDMGALEGRPWKFLNVILEKSRDEIEHVIENMERVLKPHEMRLYLYTALEIQSYFPNSLLRNHPAALDPEQVDQYFLDELCRLNEDDAFFFGHENRDKSALHPYLVKYVCFYFDHFFAHLGQDAFVREFINRRRAYVAPPAKPALATQDACKVFGISVEKYREMSRRELIQHYRRSAQQMHPDKGGDHEEFVKMTEAYECLMSGK